MSNYIITRVNAIFHNARCFIRSGNFEAMNNERKKLKEMFRDHCISKEVLRDFDGVMNYLYNSLYSL